jgi:hypothetical protein
VVILDQEAGTAELRVKRPLDCEEKTSYQFDIQVPIFKKKTFFSLLPVVGKNKLECLSLASLV